MVQQGLERDYWRKSSQWVALTRQHAQLVALDDVVKPIFERCQQHSLNFPSKNQATVVCDLVRQVKLLSKSE